MKDAANLNSTILRQILSSLLTAAFLVLNTQEARPEQEQTERAEVKATNQRELRPECSPGNYIGNVDSMKYHFPFCEYGRIIGIRRRVYFTSRDAAQTAGLSPCNWCMPRFNKSVEAKLIKSSNPPDSATRLATPNTVSTRQDSAEP